jgi:antitoxin component YwqK of YwqJK toxin-antitoxin module
MIPDGAEETRSEDADGFSTVRYLVEGRLALLASFEKSGEPAHAMTFDTAGLPDGLEREWHSSGRLRYEARYRHGLQHGLQRQWDEQGRLIVRTRFVRGSGLDLYCGDLRPGVVSESREIVDGLRHGFERWWTDGKLTQEKRFFRGDEHGISRSWTLAGKLERGWPRFVLRGQRVTRHAYARACTSDASLPRWREKDDRPSRARPVALR